MRVSSQSVGFDECLHKETQAGKFFFQAGAQEAKGLWSVSVCVLLSSSCLSFFFFYFSFLLLSVVKMRDANQPTSQLLLTLPCSMSLQSLFDCCSLDPYGGVFCFPRDCTREGEREREQQQQRRLLLSLNIYTAVIPRSRCVLCL